MRRSQSRSLFWLTCSVSISVAIGSGVSEASADEVMIESGRDNTLYFDAAGSISNGAGPHMFVGRNSQENTRRGLIYFDVATHIPSGSTIMDVTLMLYMSQSGAGPIEVDVHRVTQSWGESQSMGAGTGGQGGPAAAGDATWLHRFYDAQTWTTPGGDFDALPSATSIVDATGYYVWTDSRNLVADVQAWVNNPSTNNGWIIIGDESAPSTAKRFDTRENSDDQLWPVLTVVYGETPTVPVLSAWGTMIFCLGLATLAKLMHMNHRRINQPNL